jgi:hypothetical protein|tara:strand:- start:173 stop:436 length:264 start_codon:yes stop_codon:yes gene_type:complete
MAEAQKEIKFTDEELKKLQDVKQTYERLTINLGQLGMQRINLEMQEKALKDKLDKLMETERELAKTFSTKYGQGQLDINTGKFTPVK